MTEENIDTRSGLIAWFARNPVAANLLMFLILATGIMAAISMPRTLNPEFVSDTIQIVVPYPGASPDEVELGIILKIEEALKDIDTIEKIQSTAQESAATILLEINDQVEINNVLDEVKSAIDGISNMPEESEKPVVKHLEMRDHAVNIQLWGNLSERDMKSLIDQIKNELLQDPDIGYVNTLGSRDYEVSIEVAEADLLKYGLTLNQVSQAIRGSSLNLPGGAIKTDNGEIMLRAKGQAYRQHDFERIPLINYPDGTRLTVGDIATIKDGFVESTGFSLFNGGFSMGATVYVVGDQDLIKVADAAKAYVERKRAELPEGVNIDYWADITHYLEGRLGMMVKNLGMGALLVFIVLTLFLDIKLAFWVMVGLPLCFLGTFAMMTTPMVDISLNMISLFGFILVLGIVVDDAIIIGESAGSFSEKYGHSVDSVIAGAKRVATPATFGVLTTIVAFLPTLFAEGVFAPFPAAFGWVVLLCLSFSLVESKLILPAHLIHSKPSRKGLFKYTHALQTFCNGLLQAFIKRVYQPALKSALRNRYITASSFVAVMILAGGLVAGGMVRVIMMPSVPNDFIQASLEMVEGTTEEQMLSGYKQFNDALYAVDREYKAETGNETGLLKHVFAYAYDGRFVNFMAELTKNEVRTMVSDELAERWRSKIGEIPGARVIAVSTAQDMGGGQDVQFKLISSQPEQLKAASKDFAQHLSTYDGIYDVRNGSDSAQDEIVLSLKPMADSMGVSLADMATQIRHAFYGAEAQRMQRANDEVKVMVRYPEAERKAVSDLENMYLHTRDGVAVPFTVLANADIQPGYSKLTRINGERAVTVGGAVNRLYAEPDKIAMELKETFLPRLSQEYPGLSFKMDGMTEESAKIFNSLFVGFALAMFGIYALLAVPLKSYLQPLIIMGVIPFGIIGAVIGHLVMDLPLDMMSLFGIIALSGVVVNDSLIMVDFINRAVANGSSIVDAVVQSGSQRYRAIMLTSLTTFFGLAPMLVETSTQAQLLIPMAVSLGFGIIFATVITLILIPCLYVILEDFKMRGGRLEEAPASA